MTRWNSSLATALIVVLSGCGPASAPAPSGKDNAGSAPYFENWQGKVAVSMPAAQPPTVAACPSEADPGCDHHRLVVPASARQVLVAIQAGKSQDEEIYTNDLDLYVYDDHNNLLAFHGDADGNESVVFETTGAAYYDVRVAAYLADPNASYSAVAKEVTGQAFDDEADCTEAVPSAAGTSGVTDAGQRIELSVELLLDGTDPVRAAEVMTKAREAYAPLGIDLVLRNLRGVTIQSSDSLQILEEAKALEAGRPPAGIDVVAVFTNKQMQSGAGGTSTVIGQADCIGGIRFPAHSFAVVTDVSGIESEQAAPGFYLNMDAAAETMAHEIGHLMGAQHHYANCVEGNTTSAGPGDVSPCTLMFPAVNGESLQFGVLEGLVVRGHAVDYDAP